MKKVITITLLVVTLLVGAMTVEAKTTKKKSTTRTTKASSVSDWNGNIPSASFLYKSIIYDCDNDNYISQYEYHGYDVNVTGMENYYYNPQDCEIKASFGSRGGTVYIKVNNVTKRNNLYNEVKKYFSKKISGQLYLYELKGDTITIYW